MTDKKSQDKTAWTSILSLVF